MTPVSAISPISPWSPRASPARSSSAEVAVRFGPQFQTAPGGLSNLDRCNWCGERRAAHGSDWSCPSTDTDLRTRFTKSIIAAGVLVLIGVVLLAVTSQTASSWGSLGAAGLLAGLVMLICAGTIVSRRG
jgi:hypothetical protein